MPYLWWTRIVVCWALSTVFVVPCRAQAADEIRKALVAQDNPWYEGNSVVLLPSAAAKYDDLFQAIREAREYVDLEYFIFRLDSIGSALLHLLHEKAREGVSVRLLIDGYGNWKAPHPISRERLDSIRGLGIRTAIFDPLRFPWLPNIRHRDHRKIVVVDGRKAWTGGMNVADYYLHGTERTGPWRDMQVRLEGPVVAEFEHIFQQIWQRTTGDAASPPCASDSVGCAPSGCPVIIVNREPGKQSRQMRKAYVAALDAARERVRIVNPYPTNTRSVRRAMRRALHRGIRLQLMVSSSTDNRITPEVVAIEMKKMMRRGAEVYYYEGGFHHTKVITIDDSVAVLGTTNLDARSLRYDYEVSAFVLSPEVVWQLDTLFQRDLCQSQRLNRRGFRSRFSLGRRMLGRMFQPIKGLL